MLLNCGAGEDSWESSRRSNQSILKEISPEYSLEGLMLKLKVQYFGHQMQRINSLVKILMLGGIGGWRRRGQQRMKWWMASPTQWTWVWVDSRSWWWTGRPGVLRSMGSQRAGHHWATELNWYFVNQTTWPHRKMSLKWTEKIFKVRKYPALYHCEMQCLQLEGL